MAWFIPCLIEVGDGSPPRLGDPLVDEYLRFAAARVRRNTLLAQQFDLKVFFTVVGKPAAEVTTGDVLAFIEAQRAPRRGGNVVRIADGESGLSAATIKRRLATVSSLFDYLCMRGLVARQVVPRSLGSRHPRHRGAPLIRAPRRLPRVLSPDEVVALTGALRTERDRAMVALMLPGGLRRCEVLGLRFEDVHVRGPAGVRRRGQGRLPTPGASLGGVLHHAGGYLADERPKDSTDDHVFVVLKGPHRGRPLTAAGVDEVLAGARARAGLTHATCHELRHTCFTRLREAGMALEAIQAQAGHASLETTRVYLHLSNTWLAGEYAKAMAVLDAIPVLDTRPGSTPEGQGQR